MGGDRGRYLGTGHPATQRRPGPTRPASLCRDCLYRDARASYLLLKHHVPITSEVFHPQTPARDGIHEHPGEGGTLLISFRSHVTTLLKSQLTPQRHPPFGLHCLPLHFHHLLYILQFIVLSPLLAHKLH